MPLKNQFTVMFLSALILMGGSLFTFYKILQNEDQIAKAELNRYKSYLLAEELKQSSDNLTRMARSYTVTANPQFRKYFERILNIRDGKAPRPGRYDSTYWDFVSATGVYPSTPSDKRIPLETLMREMNFSKDELQLLRETKKESDALVEMENKAMNAMIGLYPDERGQFTIRKEPDPALAQKIMHSPEYHQIKKKIMEPMRLFFDKIDSRTAQNIAFYREKGQRLNKLLLALSFLSIFLIFISLVLTLLQKKAKRDSFAEVTEKQSPSWKRTITLLFKSWAVFMAATTFFSINIALFWWTQKILEEKSHANIKAELQLVAETIASHSEQWMEETEQILESFLLFSPLAEIYKKKPPLWKKQSDEILSPFIKRQDYTDYFLLDENNQILVSSQKNKEGHFLAEGFLVQKLRQGLQGPKNSLLLFPEKPREGSPFNKSLILGALLKNAEDKKALLVISVPLSGAFSRIAQRGRFKESGESYAFNKEAYLLSESRFNEQLYEIGILKKGESSSLSVRLKPPEKSIKEENLSSSKFTHIVHEAFKKPRGVILEPYLDYRGILVIGSWVWNAERNIGFVAELDAKEAFSTLYLLQKQFKNQQAVTFFVFFLLVVLTIWALTRISSANEKLQQAWQAIKKQKDRMEEELRLGRKIQMNLAPKDFPEKSQVDVFAKLEPVRELGGDFYDFFFVDSEKLFLVVGDVSGKGLGAALFMASSKAIIRSSAFKHKSAKTAIEDLNRSMSSNNPSCMFATVFTALLDLSSGKCSYSSAGHHSSYIKKNSGELCILDQNHGPVAGAVLDSQFSKSEVLLNKGDILMAYTDGITEANNPKGELYGEERLEKLIQQNSFDSSKELIQLVTENVKSFSGKASPADDISLIAVKYLG